MKNKIDTRIHSKRGSLMVEAAIFLPLFIIGVLTIGYLIQIVHVEENVFNAVSDETTRISAEASLFPVLQPGFKDDLISRIRDENNGDVTDVALKPVVYRIPYFGVGGLRSYTNLIGVTARCKITPRIPAMFLDDIFVDETVLSRAFVGTNERGDPTPFSEMEKDKTSEIVWVFPRSGERYHKEDCSYIVNNPKEVLLTAQIRSRYKACALCKPGDMENGALVYCFTKTGEAYHRGSCHLVERYVISMDKEDAEAKGYTPCKKCGGH